MSLVVWIASYVNNPFQDITGIVCLHIIIISEVRDFKMDAISFAHIGWEDYNRIINKKIKKVCDVDFDDYKCQA